MFLHLYNPYTIVSLYNKLLPYLTEEAPCVGEVIIPFTPKSILEKTKDMLLKDPYNTALGNRFMNELLQVAINNILGPIIYKASLYDAFNSSAFGVVMTAPDTLKTDTNGNEVYEEYYRNLISDNGGVFPHIMYKSKRFGHSHTMELLSVVVSAPGTILPVLGYLYGSESYKKEFEKRFPILASNVEGHANSIANINIDRSNANVSTIFNIVGAPDNTSSVLNDSPYISFAGDLFGTGSRPTIVDRNYVIASSKPTYRGVYRGAICDGEDSSRLAEELTIKTDILTDKLVVGTRGFNDTISTTGIAVGAVLPVSINRWFSATNNILNQEVPYSLKRKDSNTSVVNTIEVMITLRKLYDEFILLNKSVVYPDIPSLTLHLDGGELSVDIASVRRISIGNSLIRAGGLELIRYLKQIKLKEEV